MTEEVLWEKIRSLEGTPLKTYSGLDFTFKVRGREIFVSRKDKSITQSSVMKAMEEVEKLQGNVSGPKKLGVLGASYLYPIFIEIGVIREN